MLALFVFVRFAPPPSPLVANDNLSHTLHDAVALLLTDPSPPDVAHFIHADGDIPPCVDHGDGDRLRESVNRNRGEEASLVERSLHQLSSVEVRIRRPRADAYFFAGLVRRVDSAVVLCL